MRIGNLVPKKDDKVIMSPEEAAKLVELVGDSELPTQTAPVVTFDFDSTSSYKIKAISILTEKHAKLLFGEDIFKNNMFTGYNTTGVLLVPYDDSFVINKKKINVGFTFWNLNPSSRYKAQLGTYVKGGRFAICDKNLADQLADKDFSELMHQILGPGDVTPKATYYLEDLLHGVFREHNTKQNVINSIVINLEFGAPILHSLAEYYLTTFEKF